MDRSAIEAIGQLAIDAQQANRLNTDTPAIVLTDLGGSQHIQSLEAFQPGRSRYRGDFTTQHITDFAKHVAIQGESDLEGHQGFIDTDAMSAKVFFNLGDHEHPGHGDHTATLKLKPTAAYAALLGVVNRQLDQRTLHDFVEDWRDMITPVYDGEADRSRMANALASIRDVTVETARKVNHVERDMGTTRCAMESVDAKSSLTLPSGFQLLLDPYADLPSRLFRLRLGVITGNDKCALTLRIQQAEQLTEQIAEDFRDALHDKLPDTCTLVLGKFTP